MKAAIHLRKIRTKEIRTLEEVPKWNVQYTQKIKTQIITLLPNERKRFGPVYVVWCPLRSAFTVSERKWEVVETVTVKGVDNPWFNGLRGKTAQLIRAENPIGIVVTEGRRLVLSRDGLCDLKTQQWFPLDREYSGVCATGKRVWLSDGRRVDCYEFADNGLRFLFETRIKRPRLTRLNRLDKISMVAGDDKLVVYSAPKLTCLRITDTLAVEDSQDIDFRIAHMAFFGGFVYAITEHGSLYKLNKKSLVLMVQKTGVYTGIAADEHCIYLCRHSAQQIQVLRRADGEPVREWSTQACGTSICLHQNSLYMCISHRDLIQVFSS